MSLRKAQARLRRIAQTLSSDGTLSKIENDFLVSALTSIANGKDAAAALNVKAARGQRTSKYVLDKKRALEFIYGWIATAIAPEKDGGLGFTLKDASDFICKTPAAHEYGLDPNTLSRYWHKNSDKHERSFQTMTD